MAESIASEADSERLVLIIAGDDKYAMPMAVTLFSALSHIPQSSLVQIFILENGISSSSRSNIAAVVRRAHRQANVSYLSPDLDKLKDMAFDGAYNINAYLRLALTDLLPQDVTKAIYMDSDIIVRRDLTDIWKHPLGGRQVAAVRDYGVSVVSTPLCGLAANYQKLGLAADTPYFNSGLLLMDIEKWRADRIGASAAEYIAKYGAVFADQDGLNAAISGDWLELDPLWNVQISALAALDTWRESEYKESMRPRVAALLRDAYVLHFTGQRKPWNGGLVNRSRSRFDANLKSSGWFSPVEYILFRLRWLRSALGFALGDVRRKIGR